MASNLSDVRTVRDVVEQFRTLPAVREQETKAAAEREAQRTGLAAELERVRIRRAGTNAKGEPDPKGELARLAKAKDAADAAVARAQHALDAAYTEQRAAANAIAELTVACDHQRHQLEAKLVETADPRIGEFIELALNAIDATRKGFRPSLVLESKDPLTDEKKPKVQESNSAAVAQVVDALRTAIDAAAALRLAVGIDVGAELERLAASIPDLEPSIRVIDRATLQRVLAGDHGYADERRGWMRSLSAGSGRFSVGP